MSFLGMGTMEILIILLVAFIFLGPERMIDAARTLGKWTGELRRMGSTVQAEMDDLAGNVGAPLSSRHAPPDARRADAAEPPLDQDHPTPFRPRPAEDTASEAEASVTADGTPADGAQPAPAAQSTATQSNDPNSARKEETA